MRVADAFLGKGVGRAILKRIIDEARALRLEALYLETGSSPAFIPALKLYESEGFSYCGPFAEYRDDPFSRFMVRGLTEDHYLVDLVEDGASAVEMAAAEEYDVIVLDLMLPGEDGLTLCRNLRARSEIPVVMLTARGEETDRIVGLEMGADDYLPKPFSARELLARIKVILRRARSLPENLRAEEARTIRFDDWVLDTAHRHLVSSAGVVTPLSGAEYRLLRIFLRHPNRVLTRDQLVDLTQGKEADPLDRSIDVQVSRLRHRLGDDPRDPRLIKTVRGEGYVLSVPVAREP